MPATTAKKTATRKPAAKKTATPKTVAPKPAAKISMPAMPTMPAIDEVTTRVEDAMVDAVKFMRDVTNTSVGVAVVVQDRLVHRGATDTATYPNFLEEAKAKGEARMTELQDRFEPIVQRVTDRFEPITERFEANLPSPVKDALEANRERVRKLLAA
jgi:hypothetical protein